MKSETNSKNCEHINMEKLCEFQIPEKIKHAILEKGNTDFQISAMLNFTMANIGKNNSYILKGIDYLANTKSLEHAFYVRRALESNYLCYKNTSLTVASILCECEKTYQQKIVLELASNYHLNKNRLALKYARMVAKCSDEEIARNISQVFNFVECYDKGFAKYIEILMSAKSAVHAQYMGFILLSHYEDKFEKAKIVNEVSKARIGSIYSIIMNLKLNECGIANMVGIAVSNLDDEKFETIEKMKSSESIVDWLKAIASILDEYNYLYFIEIIKQFDTKEPDTKIKTLTLKEEIFIK